jgi:site-specific DNA-methyltransferase (adenine-specific)
MIEINKIYNENCLETMAKMPDNFIDLTVTSPPYDNLRTYKGYSFDFENVAKELFRVTKQGGVVVWVVGDATIKGSETGTSFRQALYAKDIGFNLHDTMIYHKTKVPPIDSRTAYRYVGEFEYMFVFSKGKPKTCNYIKIPCKHSGKKAVAYQRKPDGSIRLDRKEKNANHIVSNMKIKGNVWSYASVWIKGHPAPFPEQLANDHIISWSNEGDLVYDPFMGSGTTAKMAMLNNRNYIGSEISKEYCEIANKRLAPYLRQTSLFS